MATVDYLLFALKLFAALWVDSWSLLCLLDLRDEHPCLTVSGTGHCCHTSHEYQSNQSVVYGSVPGNGCGLLFSGCLLAFNVGINPVPCYLLVGSLLYRVGILGVTIASSARTTGRRACASLSFERQIIRERTNAGLATARARGRKGGRKEQPNSKKISTTIKLADTSPDTIADICKYLGISRSTY
ncbi:MAG: hypothetical protein AB1861_28825 [Cyanobacteriota bacterium]